MESIPYNYINFPAYPFPPLNYVPMQQTYNPFIRYTREEVIEQLYAAKKHAGDGKVKDAFQVSSNIRDKYGL